MKKIPEIKFDDIIEGDCFEIINTLPDNSIDLIVNSPPYADKRKRFYDSVHPNK